MTSSTLADPVAPPTPRFERQPDYDHDDVRDGVFERHSDEDGSPLSLGTLVAIAFVVAVIFSVTMRSGHDWGGDFAQYISHARNIASGVSYAETGYIYNIDNPVVGPMSYPPGFPLALAPVYAIFGLNLSAFKVALAVMFGAALIACGLLFRRDLSQRDTLLFLAMTAICPVFWIFKEAIVSEHLFLVTWYAAIAMADYWYRDNENNSNRWWIPVALGGLVFASYSTRSVGVVLLPAIVLCDFWVNRKVTRFQLVSCGTAIALILVQKVLIQSSGAGYTDQLDMISISSLLSNLQADVVAFAVVWDNGYSDVARKGVTVLLTLLACYGLRKHRVPVRFLEVTSALYLILILIWPSASGLRMVYPLIPAYLFFVVLGASALGRGTRWGVGSVAVVGMLAVGSGVLWQTAQTTEPIAGAASPEAVELFQYVQEQTQPDDTVLFCKPRVMALFSDRQSAAFPVTGSAVDYAESLPASVVVVRKPGFIGDRSDGMLPFEAEFSESADWAEVWSNDWFAVLRLQ